MRRIEFIAPVDAMRGNLSGSQRLEYAENNNPAWDAPEGKQFARNYRPSYVGAKRGATGLKYFNTRTKNAVNNTSATRLQRAAFGGAAAVYIAAQASSAIVQAITAAAREYASKDPKYKTIRGFACAFITEALAAREATIVIGEPWQTYKALINNPWIGGGTGTSVTIEDEIYLKFYAQLTQNGISFRVRNALGIAQSSWSFNDLISDHSTENVLSLTLQEVGASDYVKYGDYYLKDGSNYAMAQNIIKAITYDTTLTAPSA